MARLRDSYDKHLLMFSDAELKILAAALHHQYGDTLKIIQNWNDTPVPADRVVYGCAHKIQLEIQAAQLNAMANRIYDVLEKECEHVRINAA